MSRGVIVAALMFGTFWLGLAAGKLGAAADCETFGAFKNIGVTYDCKARP